MNALTSMDIRGKNNKLTIRDFYNPKKAEQIFEINKSLKRKYPENDYESIIIEPVL